MKTLVVSAVLLCYIVCATAEVGPWIHLILNGKAITSEFPDSNLAFKTIKNGDNTQLWRVEDGKLVSRARPDRCMEIPSTASGTKLIASKFTAVPKASQLWTVHADGAIESQSAAGLYLKSVGDWVVGGYATPIQKFTLHRVLFTTKTAYPFGVFALVRSNTLLWFNITTPSAVTALPIALPAGVELLSIALRPVTHQIIGLSKDGQIFALTPFLKDNTVTANHLSNLTGCTLAPTATNWYSSDFNPVADRLRVVSSTAENYRINVETGACIVDGKLFYTPSSAPKAIGVTYTNGFYNSNPAALGTAEYIIDANGPAFARVTVPNGGNTSSIGLVSHEIPAAAPIDILTHNGVHYGYTIAQSSLYQLNITTGKTALISQFAGEWGHPTGLIIWPSGASAPHPVRALAAPYNFTAILFAQNSLRYLNLATGLSSSKSITGLTDIVSIARRPANGLIYALTSTNWVILLNDVGTTVVATSTVLLTGCSLSPAAGKVYSIDFNPVADRLRVVSSTGENYRINVDTGACIIDLPLTYKSGATPNAIGVAYTPTVNGATWEFIVDASYPGVFSRVTVPNNGNTTALGPVTHNLSTHSPIDIVLHNNRYYAYTINGRKINYIDINNGASYESADLGAGAENWGVTGLIITPP